MALEVPSNEAVRAAVEAGSGVTAISRLVVANRGNGPEAVMQLVEERAPNGFASVDDVVSPDERQEIADRYKKLAGFDREALNNRASLTPPRQPALAD